MQPGADFHGADLTNADLESGDFVGADFSDAILVGAYANNAQFEDINIENSDCKCLHALRGSLVPHVLCARMSAFHEWVASVASAHVCLACSHQKRPLSVPARIARCLCTLVHFVFEPGAVPHCSRGSASACMCQTALAEGTAHVCVKQHLLRGLRC